MKPKLSDLWRWEGDLEWGPFALWGVLLFAVKFNLDRVLLQRSESLSFMGSPRVSNR